MWISKRSHTSNSPVVSPWPPLGQVIVAGIWSSFWTKTGNLGGDFEKQIDSSRAEPEGSAMG
jgi:hypothetical protein